MATRLAQHRGSTLRASRRWMIVALLFSGPFLSACGPPTIRDTASQSQVPIQGGTLELHQEMVIPARRTRVFFQDGRQLSGINEFQPHCQLRVRNISDQPQTVQPDRFRIESVFGIETTIVSRDPVLLASVSPTLIAGSGGGGGNGDDDPLMYAYFMSLQSDKQPQVSFLVCGGAFAAPAFADQPTLQDIQTAMGALATLTLERSDN